MIDYELFLIDDIIFFLFFLVLFVIGSWQPAVLMKSLIMLLASAG